jgi:hypothetical protein
MSAIGQVVLFARDMRDQARRQNLFSYLPSDTTVGIAPGWIPPPDWRF